MRKIFLLITLLEFVPAFGSDLGLIQQQTTVTPGTWSHLNQGRELFEGDQLKEAAQIFSSLYQDHHNLFALPFLKKLERYLAPELLDEISFVVPTKMSKDFKNRRLDLSSIHSVFSSEEKLLAALFGRPRTEKSQEFIQKWLVQITEPNVHNHWRDLDAHMGGDSIFDILKKSTVDTFWKEDLPFLLQAAKKGDVMYQHNLSIGFMFGKGSVPENFQNALFWNQKAADQCDENIEKVQKRLSQFRYGDVTPGKIYYNLAELYRVLQDINHAIHYFEKAVKFGYDPAKERLLRVLRVSSEFENVDVEKYKALLREVGGNENLFELAILQTRSPQSEQEFDTGRTALETFAQKGFLSAQFELAIVINPKGIPQSESVEQKRNRIQEYHSFIKMAYENMDVLDLAQQVRLAGLVFTDPELKEVNLQGCISRFFEILEKGMANGINTQYLLGLLFDSNKQYKEAAQHYHGYLETGDELYKADTLNDLGNLYMYGRGVEINYEKAIDFFDQAIEKGQSLAIYNRALMYHKGWGGKDLSKAIELYTIVSNQGDVDAWCHLGLAYTELNDYVQADVWSKKAADQGNLRASYNRIYLFLNGHTAADQTPENVREALFQNARDGSPESLITLASMLASGFEKLLIEKSPQDAKQRLDQFLCMKGLDFSHQFLAKMLLDRLKNQEMDDLEEIQGQVSQNILEPLGAIEESTMPQVSTAKPPVTKEFLRKRKETRDIERALKRKETFDQLKARQEEEKSRDLSTQADHFTDVEIAILEEFASHQGAMKEREFAPILKLLGAKSTKSGYVIKWGAETVGGHRPHASDGTVDKGDVRGVQSFVQTVMPKRKIT